MAATMEKTVDKQSREKITTKKPHNQEIEMRSWSCNQPSMATSPANHLFFGDSYSLAVRNISTAG